MVDFMERLPGRIVGLASAHPFWTTVAIMIFCAVAYVIVLKIHVALEDAKDIRNRRH